MSGRRLAEWAGLSRDAFRKRAELRNLFDELPERWDRDAATRRAFDTVLVELIEAYVRSGEEQTVVLLGEQVRDAFIGVIGRPYVWQHSWLGSKVCWMPHPSGHNRHWNDPAHVARAERFLRRLMGTRAPRARQARLRLGR